MTQRSLPEVLEAHLSEIIDRFVDAAERESPRTEGLTRDEIIDHLRAYFSAVITTLRDHAVGGKKVGSTAKEHAEQRWLMGYDIESVIREYGLLRGVALEIVHREQSTIDAFELDAFVTLLEEGMARSAAKFMALDEERLRDALEIAQRATLAREEVLAIVSHDLRNPLMVILGSAEVLLEGLAAEDPKTPLRRKSIEAIQRSSSRMVTLVSELLDQARLQSSQIRLEIAGHTAAELIDPTLEHLLPIAGQKQVHLTRDGDLSVIAWCDASRILQVLENLVGNAIKFSPKGGTIVMRADREGDGVCFSVIDQGPGIEPDAIEKIFDRFWSTPGEQRSTGLGLAIAKGFVELHGGRIWVESEPGKGAKLSFCLPGRPLDPGP